MWAAIILQEMGIKLGDYIMIQTYFGNGKGKTTAAVGSAVRCAGCGNKVLFVNNHKRLSAPDGTPVFRSVP